LCLDKTYAPYALAQDVFNLSIVNVGKHVHVKIALLVCIVTGIINILALLESLMRDLMGEFVRLAVQASMLQIQLQANKVKICVSSVRRASMVRKLLQLVLIVAVRALLGSGMIIME